MPSDETLHHWQNRALRAEKEVERLRVEMGDLAQRMTEGRTPKSSLAVWGNRIIDALWSDHAIR